MSDYRHWTSDEEKYIQEHWRLQTDGEMAAALDRSEGLYAPSAGSCAAPHRRLGRRKNCSTWKTIGVPCRFLESPRSSGAR